MALISLTPLDIANIRITADGNDTAGRVRVAYGYRQADGDYQNAIVREATDLPYGSAEYLIESRWIHRTPDADNLARRTLERLARPKLSVSFSTARRSISPLDTISIDHPWLPSTPADLFVLEATLDLSSYQLQIAGEILYGSAPRTRILSRSQRLTVPESGGIDVGFRDGQVTITVLDPDGRPAPGALVSLDGGLPKRTNAQGKVTFAAQPGRHTIAVELSGYQPYELEIDLFG